MAFQSLNAPVLGDRARQDHGAFRAIMEAMARPGKIISVAPGLSPPVPLAGATAAILLALSDFETAIWLDEPLASATEISAFLRFHTSSRLVSAPGQADFAVISKSADMPRLAAFSQGTAEYPDRSTLVVVQVETLSAQGWHLRGPGIPGEARLSANPLPADFVRQLETNRQTFPRGVDLVFVAGTEIVALPRSTRVSEAS